MEGKKQARHAYLQITTNCLCDSWI